MTNITDIDYIKLDYNYQHHHERYVKYVENMKNKLICQDCSGEGGYVDVISWDIGGPWEVCGWCEGTGLITPYNRGIWLRMKKINKVKK